MTLYEAMLRAKLESIQQREQKEDRRSQKRFIGIQASGWLGGEHLQVGAETFRVVFCPSALAVREQMAAHDADGPRLVLVTECDERQLGVDVQARVYRNRFQAIDPWSTVLEMFQATRLGPLVPKAKWLQEELAAALAAERPALAAGNLLDLETVKEVVFRRLQIGPRPDVGAVVQWAAGEAASGYPNRSQDMRQQVRAWVEETAGPAGGLLLDVVDGGYAQLVMPLGVALRCVVDDSGTPDTGERDALVRLEQFVGKRKVRRELLVPWVEAAEEQLRQLLANDGLRASQPVLDSAEQLLAELGVQELAFRSSFVRSGLLQREKQFAEAVALALQTGLADLGQLEAAAKAVASHKLADVERRRAIPAAVEMAVRLLRWRNRAPEARGAEPQSFSAAALRYATEGSFVDWARERITLGYPHEALQSALRELWSQASAAREVENRRFGELCADWSRAPMPVPELVPLERVLEDVVGPLAKQRKVLLVVLDGASLAVFHELAADLAQSGWIELGPSAAGDVGAKRYGVALLPTVTEVSRASLLTGKVQVGNQDVERGGFESHPALLRIGKPPRLLHKDGLSRDRVGIDPGVASVVASESQVVGVVINAIDDWLSKGDQDVAPWHVDRIRPLGALLELASQSGRVVLITSDHGHVREHATELREPAESARHRGPGPLHGGELLVTGPRVGYPGGAVVVPWTEQIRYCQSRWNGYHGGISPQEVLVPLALFVRHGQVETIEGYAETLPGRPAWWEATSAVPVAPRRPAARPRGAAQPVAGTLPFQSSRESLIEALLQSPVFLAQRDMVRRGWPGEDRLREVLLAFARQGDAMTLQALANTLGMPVFRLQGALTQFRRALNFDGRDGLEFDADSGTVRVHWDMLRIQFGLDQEKSK